MDIEMEEDSIPNRKRSRTQSSPENTPMKQPQAPIKRRSPRSRRCTNAAGEISNGNVFDQGCQMVSEGKILNSPSKSPQRKSLSDQLCEKPKSKRNPRDPAQMQAVKEALHLATLPANIVCHKEEQREVLEFCKGCIQHKYAGSLYVCGCPGTGKTISIDRVKELLVVWTKEVGYQLPDMLTIYCTSLTNMSAIFSKILEHFHPRKKLSGSSPLQHLQNLFSRKGYPTSTKMMLLVVDEMDYLITKDCVVLHDLFMLTTFPFCRCILVGITNAIDLADRFLPKLESLNCSWI